MAMPSWQLLGIFAFSFSASCVQNILSHAALPFALQSMLQRQDTASAAGWLGGVTQVLCMVILPIIGRCNDNTTSTTRLAIVLVAMHTICLFVMGVAFSSLATAAIGMLYMSTPDFTRLLPDIACQQALFQ